MENQQPPERPLNRRQRRELARMDELLKQVEAKAKQPVDVQGNKAENRSRLFTVIGLAVGFGSWGYFVLAPAPKLIFGLTLFAVSGLFLIVAVWEYFARTLVKLALTLVIAGAAYKCVSWARSAYSPSVGKGFMQLGYIRFTNKQFVAGERLSINVWIKNEGSEPVDNMYHVFEANLVPIGVDPNKADGDMHAKLLADALKEQADEINQGHKGVTVGKGEGVWNTLTIPPAPQFLPLNQGQIDEIMRGNYRLYVYVWARWKDGPHDLDLCQWLQPPAENKIDNSELTWHLCAPY